MGNNSIGLEDSKIFQAAIFGEAIESRLLSSIGS